MDGLDASAFYSFNPIIIVSSTYGHSEIPDNRLAIFASAEAGADLSGKDYVVFARGDRTYADKHRDDPAFVRSVVTLS